MTERNLNWKQFPQVKPVVEGYYMTCYSGFDGPDDLAVYFKPIWWDGQKWFPWRRGIDHIQIYGWVDGSRTEFCGQQFNFVEEIPEVPNEIRETFKECD